MNSRECFREIMHFRSAERVPLCEFQGFDPSTIIRWHGEGLPLGMSVSEYFGFDEFERVPIDLGPIPRFVYRLLKEDDMYKVFIDPYGITVRRRKSASTNISAYLDHPIKKRDDFERMKRRFNPDDPRRYPLAWSDELIDYYNSADHPVWFHILGLFRTFQMGAMSMGTHNLLTTFYKDPELIHNMFSFWIDFVIATVENLVENVKIDFCWWTEDLAGTDGPMVSPKIYREFFLPYTRKATDFLKRHEIDIIMLDCSGNINSMIPLFLEAGFNSLNPVEVNAGMEALELRRKYGRQLTFMGNISLQALIEGGERLEKEVRKKVPYLIKDGGFIPCIDDIVSPDVSFPNYIRYINILKEFTNS